MKKIIFLTVFLFVFSTTSRSFAKMQYPVSELGNCRDAQECFYYCEVPANISDCSIYAQKISHVLGDATGSAQNSQQVSQFMNDARDALGCDSEVSCSAFCSKAENHQRCENFSRSEREKGVQLPFRRNTGRQGQRQQQQFQQAQTVPTLDCSKSENVRRCQSQGNFCGNFCHQYPSLCQATSATHSETHQK